MAIVAEQDVLWLQVTVDQGPLQGRDPCRGKLSEVWDARVQAPPGVASIHAIQNVCGIASHLLDWHTSDPNWIVDLWFGNAQLAILVSFCSGLLPGHTIQKKPWMVRVIHVPVDE